jgi:hypothetical protein
MKFAMITAAAVCLLGATQPARAGVPAPSGSFGPTTFLQQSIGGNSVTGMLNAQVNLFDNMPFDPTTFTLTVGFGSLSQGVVAAPSSVTVFLSAIGADPDICDGNSGDVVCNIEQGVTFTGGNGFNPVGTTFTAQLTLTDDNATFSESQVASFIGTAASVPEPVSLALLGAGLAGLAISRRRSKA